MHEPPLDPNSQFSLKPGECVTDCFPLWTSGCDRMLEEVATCNHCWRPTYRVMVVVSAGGLERRAALCVNHFTAVDGSLLPGEPKRLEC
jgi:hypothetical protein